MQLSAETIDKWIPYKLLDKSGELFCEWLYTGDEQFRASFFENTIKACRRLPENTGAQKNITSIVQLTEWAAQVDVEGPSAIIFHVSRCGSTIVSQALANNINHIVLSEVPFFDDVLKTPSAHKYRQGQLLKDAVKLYSQPKNRRGSKVFIKTDSWHIMYYKQLRQMYPAVPFILLYRNPAEVIRSQNKQAGKHCIPQFIAPNFFGIKEEAVTAADFYDYPAKVTEKYLEAYIDISAKDANAFLFNYNQGMLKVVEDIYSFIDMPFTESDRAQMRDRLVYHSKLPGMHFSPEPVLQSGSDRFAHLFELYGQLEELRLKQF